MSNNTDLTNNNLGQDLQSGQKAVDIDTAKEKNLLTAEQLLEQELDNVISYDQLLILTKEPMT